MRFVFLVFLWIFSFSAVARFEIPDHVQGRLTEDEIRVFNSMSPKEIETLEVFYGKYMNQVEDSVPEYKRKLHQRLFSSMFSWTKKSLQRIGGYVHSLGVTESYMDDLELAFFKNPKAFLKENSLGIFAQVGVSFAFGVPRRAVPQKGHLLLVGVSIFKAKKGGLVIQFHQESLKLKKLYTPTVEFTTLAHAGYESVRAERGEAMYYVERELLPAGIIRGVTENATQGAWNPSPFAFPPYTTFTASKYSGDRRIFFSLEITNRIARKLPFFRKILTSLEEPVGKCATFL